MVDIYLAMKRLSKYPPLFTASVNNCELFFDTANLGCQHLEEPVFPEPSSLLWLPLTEYVVAIMNMILDC